MVTTQVFMQEFTALVSFAIKYFNVINHRINR